MHRFCIEPHHIVTYRIVKLSDIFVAAVFALVGVSCSAYKSHIPLSRIVDTNRHDYTYAEMLDDIRQLALNYPDYVSWEPADTSVEGRMIPVVRLGRDDARRHIMIQATMHAREYMASHLVMVMIEGTAWKRVHGVKRDGRRFYDILDDVQLTILPMVNPDGVEISQRGREGCLTDSVRNWVDEMIAAGEDPRLIKSNARGVDLNRNFSNGHGESYRRVGVPAFAHYPGEAPFTEPEVGMMLNVVRSRNFDLCLNYHTSGNLIYHGCGNAPEQINDKALTVARLIGKRARYPLFGPEISERPNGSWADEVELNYGIPSVTVELGTTNPVPPRELDGLLSRNAETWIDVILAVEQFYDDEKK